MDDLKARLDRELDQVRVRPFDPSIPTQATSHGYRFLVIAFALVIGLGVILLVGRAIIRSDATRPGDPNPVTDDGAEVPDVLLIECGSDGTTVSNPRVQAQSDSVHIQVDSGAKMDEVIITTPVPTEGGDGWTMDIDLSSSSSSEPTVNVAINPGDVLVGCFTDEQIKDGPKDWSSAPGMVPVTILPPAGGVVSSDLRCDEDQTESSSGFTQAGPFASEEEAIRELVVGVDATDSIERVGYPDDRLSPWTEGASYVILRNGEAVASVVLMPQSGGLMITQVDACDGSGIRVANAS